MNARSTLPAGADVHSATDGQSRREWYRNEYLRSAHWQQQRKAALQRAGNRCQVCNGGQQLDVHHRTYERIGNERPEDLTVLCRRCHSLFHGEPKVKPAKRPAAATQQRRATTSGALPHRNTNWARMSAQEQQALTDRLLTILATQGPHSSSELAYILNLRSGPIGACLDRARRHRLARKANGKQWATTTSGRRAM